MSTTKTNVAIIVLNWNQPKLTQSTVASLKSINHSQFNYQIYLIDNGSTDNSSAVFNKLYSNDSSITLLKTSSNLGFVGGNNLGLLEAQKNNYNYYLFINNDVSVHPNFLSTMVEYANRHPQVGLIAPKIYFAPGYEYHHNRYKKTELGKIIWFAGGKIDWDNIYCSHIGIDEFDHGQHDTIIEPDYLTGCCLLASASAISQVGLFDDKYFLYLEDADICVRAKIKGFKIIYLPTSYIWHLNSGSSGANSNLHHYFITRNRLLFGYRYASTKTKLALLKQSLAMIFNSPSVWQKKGIIDYYLGKLGRGSWHDRVK